MAQDHCPTIEYVINERTICANGNISKAGHADALNRSIGRVVKRFTVYSGKHFMAATYGQIDRSRQKFE